MSLENGDRIISHRHTPLCPVSTSFGFDPEHLQWDKGESK